MAIELEIARLSKILVDAEGIHFEEAQQRLRALTLEIVVGDGVVLELRMQLFSPRCPLAAAHSWAECAYWGTWTRI